MGNNLKATAVLFTSLFLVMVGFGIIIPVLPFFVINYGGGPTTLGLLMASYSLMQFFFAPFWGRLSDRIGRRPVLLIGLSGYGVTFILFGLSTELWMMFAARLLSGMVSSATLPTAMAYIADITEDDKRSGGMGLMGASMGLGMIFGPALGGWLGHYGFHLPFFVAGFLAILTVPFALAFLPESLKVLHKEKVVIERNISFDVVKNPLFVFFALGFTLNFIMSMFESTFALFAADRVGFDPREMGILFTILGILGVIIQGGLVGRLSEKFGDANLIKAGILVSAFGMGLILLAGDMMAMILFTSIFSSGGSLLGASSSSLISKLTEGGQGTTMGVMQSFGSLGRIMGPVTGGLLYEIHSSIPYTVGALTFILVFFLIKVKVDQYPIKQQT